MVDPGCRVVPEHGPCLDAHDVDRYTVSASVSGEQILARATTARDVVTAALRHLPSDLGPVTRGVDPPAAWGNFSA